MTCEEFQRALPFIIESGGNPEEEEHLRTCKVCSDLVSDLRYIADQAKLLVPMEDPSPKVWKGIEKQLEQEGLVRPTGPRRRLLGRGRMRQGPRLVVPVFLIALLLGLGVLERGDFGASTGLQAGPEMGNAITREDQEVLSQISATAPSIRALYETNLKTLNAQIADTSQHLAQNPNDESAREFLMNAYDQKQILYRMALTRSKP
jgi:ribosomal protein S15P/S13E